jgi:hypothetical protein
MNKVFKALIIDKTTSLYFHLFEFKNWHSKNLLSIGSFIFMSANSMTAFAASDNDRASLIQHHIANSQQSESSLREQLLDKTRELEEYKANIFRSSHPLDQAKITELSQRIAAQEKLKNELLDKIHEYEDNLSKAKKQLSSLEISSNALTDYIHNQRIAIETEKQEFLDRIRKFEEDPSLANERKINKQLLHELIAIKHAIFLYENQIAFLEYTHENDLYDALQDSAMLKFELAEAKDLYHQKERELIVSSLNYLTMALDHANAIKSKYFVNKDRFVHTKQKLSFLKLQNIDLVKENLQLQQENSNLVYLNKNEKVIQEKYIAEKYHIDNKIQEKEEALNAATLHFEGAIADYEKQIQYLKSQLDNQETINRNFETLSKKQLEDLLIERDEILSRAMINSEIFIQEHLNFIKDLEVRLLVEENAHSQLRQAYENLTQNYAKISDAVVNHEMNKQSLELALEEKEKLLNKTSSDSLDQLANNQNFIDELKSKLAQEEKTRQQLQEELAMLHSTYYRTKESLETSLNEKEKESKAALAASLELIAENQSQSDTLQKKLIQIELAHEQLKKEHTELNTVHFSTKESLEKSLQDKENALQKTLTASLDSLTENQSKITDLQQKLVQKELAHELLKQEHFELDANHFSLKELLEKSLIEKEKELQETLTASLESLTENLSVIEDLKQQLVLQENTHKQLQTEHAELHVKHAHTKESLENALKQSEEKLQLALTASQTSIEEYQSLINSLKGTLVQEQEKHTYLKQNYDDLLFKYSENEKILATNEFSKQQLEQSLHEKEASLIQQQNVQKQYETKHDLQFHEIKILEQQIESLLTKQEEAGQSNNHLREQLSHLSTMLEQKEREFEQNNHQLQVLQHMNEQLNQSMVNSLYDLNRAEEEYSKKIHKERELEHAIQALTIVAEQQDHALAEANSTFSMIQEYNKHLEEENASLKNRLNSMETAEGSFIKEKNEHENENRMHPAILKLLKPKY